MLPGPGRSRPVDSFRPDIRWRPGPLPCRWTVAGRGGRTHPPGRPRGPVAGDLDHRRGNTARFDGLRRQRCRFDSQGIRDRYGSRSLSGEDLIEPGFTRPRPVPYERRRHSNKTVYFVLDPEKTQPCSNTSRIFSISISSRAPSLVTRTRNTCCVLRPEHCCWK